MVGETLSVELDDDPLKPSNHFPLFVLILLNKHFKVWQIILWSFVTLFLSFDCPFLRSQTKGPKNMWTACFFFWLRLFSSFFGCKPDQETFLKSSILASPTKWLDLVLLFLNDGVATRIHLWGKELELRANRYQFLSNLVAFFYFFLCFKFILLMIQL